MQLNTIKEADLKGKRVLIRVDFNVPLKNGVVTDNTRIRAALPTVKYILDQGASLVVMSHFGRPKGQKNPDFSMAPIAKEFEKLLGVPVKLAPDVIGCCWKTCGSARRRRPTIPALRRLSHPMATSTATTLSELLTVHMPPQRVSPTTCLHTLAS